MNKGGESNLQQEEAENDDEDKDSSKEVKSTPSSGDFKGARPKVRNTEEAEQWQKMLKKVQKSSEKETQEKSVYDPRKPVKESQAEDIYNSKKSGTDQSYTEEREHEPTSDDDVRESSCPEFFGVRSYLHHFYETMTVKNPDLYEDFDEHDNRYLTTPGKRCRMGVYWKATLCIGFLLLICGLILLFVGYYVRQRDVVVGYKADLEIIDRSSLDFNRNLDICKVLGLLVFCLGGAILLAALLLPTLVSNYCDDDDQEAFKVKANFDDPQESPTEKKIPATEALTSVQPKRGEDHMVITEVGLCKVP
ncbi:neurensin-1-like [Limulus polyphemus]|uniref:Neurensin-1-like n=1 Tax=Limulus polyphemus TaxID=6850 RepID=A0ABM1BCX4_LIMPO|nr:neurensin-1-like [Limulus polyphemus]